MAWGDKVKTLLTGSSIFDFQREQVVLPGELLALQGLDCRQFRLPTQPSHLTDLVGESFHAACIAGIMASIFLCEHAVWWERRSRADAAHHAP